MSAIVALPFFLFGSGNENFLCTSDRGLGSPSYMFQPFLPLVHFWNCCGFVGDVDFRCVTDKQIERCYDLQDSPSYVPISGTTVHM
jgi:hypothetical protein